MTQKNTQMISMKSPGNYPIILQETYINNWIFLF